METLFELWPLWLWIGLWLCGLLFLNFKEEAPNEPRYSNGDGNNYHSGPSDHNRV